MTALTTESVRARKLRRFQGFAESAFAEHMIETHLEQDVHRHYRCGRPDTVNYHFHIVTFPGRLVVVGDIGDLIVERTRDMLQWVPGSVNSIDYFEEKVPSCFDNFEYDADVARAWIQEMRDDPDGEIDWPAELDELARWCDQEDEFIARVSESSLVDLCEFPDFRSWTPNFLWCREAVRWFCINRGLLEE